MKVKRLLVLLFTLSLLIGSAFAISASADGDTAPRIASYNISYEGDFKFMVAVPKTQVGETLTFTVSDGNVSKSVTKKVEQLGSDTFADPTLNGVEMWAIRSDFQISAKDMAKEYTLTVTSDIDTDNEKTSDAVTYSLAMYLNERLYKNGVILAEDGTQDADRRDLYLSTLEYGHNAEYVLYNLDENPDNDVTVFVDELVYSNISGKYQLYQPGTSVTAPNRILKVSTFSYTDGRWEKGGTVEELWGKTVTLNEHQIYSTDLNESWKDGKINAAFATPKLTYFTAGGEAVTNAEVWDGYYTTDNGTSLTDAEGNTYYDKFSLVNSYDGHSNVLRVQNLDPVIYTEDGEGNVVTENGRNNAHIVTPLIPTVATDGVKANDVYVFELDVNIQSENEAEYQLVMRDVSGNAMFNLALAQDGVLRYEEITPGVVVTYEETKADTELANLIFDKNWHKVRIEIGFGYRYTKVYVDGALELEYVAGLHNNYDYAKDVEARRAYGSAEIFVANDFTTDIYLDNVQFTKYDAAATHDVWSADSELSLVSEDAADAAVFKTLFTAKTLNENDGKTAIVLGNVPTRASSRKANEILATGVAEYYDSETETNVLYNNSIGYVIFAIGNEVAIAYSNEDARDLAFDYFVTNYSVETLNVSDGELASYFNADALRGAMYASYFNTLRDTLVKANVENADAIVNGISNIYGNMYSGEILTWIASLYDPDIGGFYYSNSARDTVGFYPDLESTSQATAMLERLGIVSAASNNFYFTTELVGETIHNTMLNWVRGLQSADDGCFYHPQWEGESASRVGRDIDSAIHLFGRLQERPYYDIPGVTDEKYQGIGAPAVATSALTGKLSASGISAVSKVVAVADDTTSSLPTYLQSIGNWADYLAGLGFNETGRSYPAGNTISSIHRLVTQADNDYAAAKEAETAPDISAYSQYIPNYLTTTTPYVDYLENYLNSIQADNGFWEAGTPTWAGLNGLMKISAAYSSYGRTIQKSLAAFNSSLQVAQSGRSGKESACYIFNAWTCLSSMLGLVAKNDTEENFATAKASLLAAAPNLIAISYDVYSHHALKNEDGEIYGFSYYEDSPMNYSQSAHVGYSDVPEADINSTMLASSSFLGVLFSTLNYAVDENLQDGVRAVKLIPLWNYKTDLDIFVEAWKAAPKVDKSIPEPEIIDFNDGEMDNSIRLTLGSSGNTSEILAAPDKTDDLALKLHYETAAEGGSVADDTDYGYMYVKFVDQLAEGNTYYYEMDLFVESSNTDALFMQYLLLDATKTTDITAFNLYNSSAGLRVECSYRHPGAGTEEATSYTFDGIPATGGWIRLSFVTTKTYTDDVLTGLSTAITVKSGETTRSHTFNDCYILDTETAAENDILDVNVGRAWIVQYKQSNSYNMWIDNIWCGKKAPQ